MLARPATSVVSAGLAIHDTRNFFEKTLQYGLAQKIIGPQRCAALGIEAPKGMVQIARYFGTEFLHANLELARERLVNLVSLQLEHASAGDLHQAAVLLRDCSLLSLSKAGSDWLRAMLALPNDDQFFDELAESVNGKLLEKQSLEEWSLLPFAVCHTEQARRQEVQKRRAAALWFAAQLGLSQATVLSSGWLAGPVISTALLLLAAGESALPNRREFDEIIAKLRLRHGSAKTAYGAWTSKPLPTAQPGAKTKSKAKTKSTPGKSLNFQINLPANLPEAYRALAEQQRREFMAALPLILESQLSFHALFESVDTADYPAARRAKTAPLLGKLVCLEAEISEELHEHEESIAAAWQATFGNSTNSTNPVDESALLTYCLCLAAGAKGSTKLSEKSALSLLRKIQKNGLQLDIAQDFIKTQAPPAFEADYLELWDDFMEESQRLLQSDVPGAEIDALALLRRECRVG